MTTSEEHPTPLPNETARPPSGAGSHALHPAFLRQVFEQLKQRNVFRIAALYLAVCWVILEPVHVIFHMLELPVWANRLVILIMMLGFPAVVIFAWVYEVTPEGLKLAVEVPHPESVRNRTGRRLDRAIIAVLAVALIYFVIDKFGFQRQAAVSEREMPATATQNNSTTPSAFNPPAHSIAVLPFVNLSEDREQEYFSDGLTEELLNSLAQINGLQVAARTSSFSFKEHPDIATVAHKLNVGAVLEGSVRRSAHTVRITAQLVNAVTGFHLWSKTYDRDLGDVLKLQTEIATTVASALKVTLLGDEAEKIELGGTRNPAAFDAYLRATKAHLDYKNPEELQAAIAGFGEAIRLDPNYARAYAARSRALSSFAKNFARGASMASINRDVEADARKALALAPDLGLGHRALALAFIGAHDLARADQEYERAIALDSGNSLILDDYGSFAVNMGHTEDGLKALRHALALDPLNVRVYGDLGLGLIQSRRQDEALRVLGNGRAVSPDDPFILVNTGIAHYLLGNYQAARTSCEQIDQRHSPFAFYCLAMTYDKLGRHADAEAVFAKLRALRGEATTAIVEVYAQWGQTNRALDGLETAMRFHDPSLQRLKVAPLLDPLRKEPRFQAIQRELKFPSD